MRSKPVSRARTRARWAAFASTSMAVEGSRALSLRETITCPASFLLTTPQPAHCSETNEVPSKFTLYRGLSGGRQLVGGHPTGAMVDVLWRAKSHSRVLACFNNWSSETIDLPSLWLFLRFQIAYMTMEKRAGSLLSAKTQWIRSIKDGAWHKLSWFQRGTLLQISSSFGQRAWHKSSWPCWQSSQVSLVMIFLFTKFVFVGKEFFAAIQTKFLTLLGTGKPQTDCH